LDRLINTGFRAASKTLGPRPREILIAYSGTPAMRSASS